ncbi:MMPL family transporter, partial [Kaarinaea lacus]
ATRFTATLQTMSTNELLALDKRATDWLKANTKIITKAKSSGPTMMFAHIGKRNIISMLGGTTVALIGISFILIIALKSFKIGLISLMPNLVPAAMGFGLWGLLVGEVGLSLSVVAGMTLGIVVDDTVHFLSKYLRARRERGASSEDAVRYAFRTVGMALFTTSVVLVVGFLVLSLSSFQLNSGMGLLTAIVIGFALLADFMLLPPLLMKLDHKHIPATLAQKA